MNYTELRKTSLEFRRLSSNLLNSNDDNADVNLSRFLNYINCNEMIRNIINQKISGIDFDFKECFTIESDGWASFNIPTDEAVHIKAQYDYLTFIDESEKVSVWLQAMKYCWSDKTINGKIQKFMDLAFKPLIDFINDQISMEMIAAEEEYKLKLAGNTFIQNIETVNGAANQQGSGIINSYNVSNEARLLLSLVDKFLSYISSLSNIDEEALENVKDDLEIIQEQLKTEKPKKNRLSKALSGIKKFVGDFSMKLGVSIATGAVIGMDWNTLIQQIETFIGNIV